jgi:spore coat protein A
MQLQNGESAMAEIELLDPTLQEFFENELPLPERIAASSTRVFVLQMRETEQSLGLVDENGDPLITTVWGYGQGQATYPGPTIVAYENITINVFWQNHLPRDGHLLPVDTSLHWANSESRPLDDGYVPTVTHLHGGHSSSGSDGLPEAWFTQNHGSTGPDFTDRIYTYENDQEAATLWYHDHALGITRLNVYAGLAGFYLLRDDNETALITAGVIPGGAYEIEMAIQDRAFTADGQLYYPAFPDDPLPGTEETVADALPENYEEPLPSVVPEFFGDFILVNGMAWPHLEVDPAEYRFRFLNGSDSRFYVLQLDDPEVEVTLIGTDGGLLPHPITLIDGVDAGDDGLADPGEQFVLAPGDRLDLVFNFQDVADHDVTLMNIGPAFEPFRGLTADGLLVDATAATPDDSVGQIMQFRVAEGAPIDNATFNADTDLNSVQPLSEADAAQVRRLGLFEGTDDFGRLIAQLGVAEETTDINGNPVEFGPLAWEDPITETPQLGTTEVWEFYNFTEDAHPIHMHLVQFQVLGRQQIEATDDVDNNTGAPNPDGIPDDVNGDGEITIDDDVIVFPESTLYPEDRGIQDTVWVGPGEVIRIIAEFDRPGEYVWHCHILSHEDHEMMRPYEVVDTDDNPTGPLNTLGEQASAEASNHGLWKSSFFQSDVSLHGTSDYLFG